MNSRGDFDTMDAINYRPIFETKISRMHFTKVFLLLTQCGSNLKVPLRPLFIQISKS